MLSEDVEEDGKMSGSPSAMETSAEFLLLRPLCVAIVQEPTPSNLISLQKALSLIEDPSPHLAQYVLFPFAIHLKRFHTFKDQIKTKLLSCLAEVFLKFEVSSWQMFSDIFQRLHVAVCLSEDPTIVSSTIPEDQLDAAVSCINVLCRKNLPRHFETLFGDKKIGIVAHSLVIALQICSSNAKKETRLRALDIIHIYVSKCSNKETESRKLFRFLPGIISSIRKIVDVRVGRLQHDIFMKGMELLQDAIIVTTAYEDEASLAQPDTYISVVLSQISKSILQNEIPGSRSCLLEVTDKLLTGIGQKMPTSRDILMNNLMILQTVTTTDEVDKISSVLTENAKYCDIGYDKLLEMMRTALMEQQVNNDSDCVTTLAKVSSYLTLVQLNYFELKEFLDLLFSVIRDSIVAQLRSVQESYALIMNNTTLTMCSKIGKSLLVSSNNFQDIFEICEDKFNSCKGNLQSNLLGCVNFMNNLLRSQILTQPSRFTKLDVLQFSEYYIEILDIQSTELVLNILETEAPKTISLLDVQKAVLLEGMGLMAKVYPKELNPIVLYHIIECAGLNSSPLISESAQQSLISLSEPKSLPEFLSDHLFCVMNELNVRILNLALHPNCPNVLIFLAHHFDFSQSIMVNLVDKVISRSCDPFSGGHLQYLYSKVFYAFVVSLWTRRQQQNCHSPDSEQSISFLSHTKKHEKSLMEYLHEYQQSLGLSPSSQQTTNEADGTEECSNNSPDMDTNEIGESGDNSEEMETANPKLSPELDLVNKICHRVLNFLPNSERSVRLLAMDCLMKAIFVLRNDEDTLLPLAHVVWQNLIPRIMEKDFVVVRKSFELLLCLCTTCGTFLKKRTMDEIFPKLSTLLTNLALESEQVALKNRKVYTYSQSYKLQLTVLQGLSKICQCLDIQEEELHQVIDGCILYLKPNQHKNLQDAARQLIDSLGSENSTTKYRSIWMRLIALGLRVPPKSTPHSSFTPVPNHLILL